MGILSNGFEYTDVASARTVNITRWQFTFTEYYNILTNQSCLAITPKMKTGRFGAYNNVVNLDSKVSKCGISVDGEYLTAADGTAPAVPNGNYSRYRVSDSISYQSIVVGGSGTSFPWYSKPITHNNDGSKTVIIKGAWKCNYQIEQHKTDGTITYKTIYKTMADESIQISLETIPRGSTLYMRNTTVGSSVTGELYAANPSYTHIITAEYADGYEESIDTTTLEFTPDSEHAYASMTANETYTVVTFTVDTYNEGVFLASTTTTCNVNAENIAPTVSITEEVLNPQLSLTGTDKIIKNYSNVQITLTASAANGANVSYYGIGTNSSAFAEGDTKTFNLSQIDTFYAKVIDSRNKSTIVNETYDSVDYFKPIIVSHSVGAIDANLGTATATVNGTFANVDFGLVQNDIYLSGQVYDVEDDSWSSIVTGTVTKDGNNFSGTINYSNLNYQHSYYAYVYCYDMLLSANEPAPQYINSTPIFYWTKNKVVFKKDVEAKEDITIAGDTTVGNIDITGVLSLANAISIAQGGTGATTAADALTNLGIKKPVKIADNLGFSATITFADIDKYNIFASSTGQIGVKCDDDQIRFYRVGNNASYQYTFSTYITINGTTLTSASSTWTYRNNSYQSSNHPVLGEVWAIA